MGRKHYSSSSRNETASPKRQLQSIINFREEWPITQEGNEKKYSADLTAVLKFFVRPANQPMQCFLCLLNA